MNQKLKDALVERPFSRMVLLVTIWMTWRVTQWAFEFATNASQGHEVATTILAITAPFTALQAFAFKVYTDGKELK